MSGPTKTLGLKMPGPFFDSPASTSPSTLTPRLSTPAGLGALGGSTYTPPESLTIEQVLKTASQKTPGGFDNQAQDKMKGPKLSQDQTTSLEGQIGQKYGASPLLRAQKIEDLRTNLDSMVEGRSTGIENKIEIIKEIKKEQLVSGNIHKDQAKENLKTAKEELKEFKDDWNGLVKKEKENLNTATHLPQLLQKGLSGGREKWLEEKLGLTVNYTPAEKAHGFFTRTVGKAFKGLGALAGVAAFGSEMATQFKEIAEAFGAKFGKPEDYITKPTDLAAFTPPDAKAEVDKYKSDSSDSSESSSPKTFNEALEKSNTNWQTAMDQIQKNRSGKNYV